MKNFFDLSCALSSGDSSMEGTLFLSESVNLRWYSRKETAVLRQHSGYEVSAMCSQDFQSAWRMEASRDFSVSCSLSVNCNSSSVMRFFSPSISWNAWRVARSSSSRLSAEAVEDWISLRRSCSRLRLLWRLLSSSGKSALRSLSLSQSIRLRGRR